MKTIYLLFNTGPYVRAIPSDSSVYERALESIDERERILVTDLPEGWRDCIVRDGKLILPPDDVLQEREAIRERKILQNEQETLRRALAATDYQAIKFAEGALTKTDFAPIKKERAALRERYNQIEALLSVDQDVVDDEKVEQPPIE